MNEANEICSACGKFIRVNIHLLLEIHLARQSGQSTFFKKQEKNRGWKNKEMNLVNETCLVCGNLLKNLSQPIRSNDSYNPLI